MDFSKWRIVDEIRFSDGREDLIILCLQVKAQADDCLGTQFLNPGSGSRPLDRATSFANIYDRFQSNVMDERETFFRNSSMLVQRSEPERGSIYDPSYSDLPVMESASSRSFISHAHSWPGSCTTSPSGQNSLLLGLQNSVQDSVQGNDNVHLVDFLSSPQSRVNDDVVPGDGIKLDLTMSTGSASSEPEITAAKESIELDLTLDLTMSTR